MPPPLPSSSASRLLPTLVRAFSSTSSAGSSAPTPSKQHHVKSYPASAFPLGFSVASTHSGIKKTGALDLGVLVSDRPCAAAASVTRNVFKAAPVTVTTQVLEKGKGRVQGFVVNSGCANAVTGKKGLEDAWAMSRAVGEGVLVMSTGVIGQHLPIDGITGAIPKLKSTLASTPEAWLDLAKAFMTTDTFPKLRTKTITLGGKEVHLAGIDKGAGMIAPNMGPPHATLLGVVATDAAIAPEALQSALDYAVDRSFNSITVDGDVSTNDTILCLANGAVEGKELTASDPEFEVFREELRSFAEELAQLVVRDGEGATKFVTVRVKNAPTFDVANAVARSVASSSLVKTAFYGQDANWGRILCAVGYTAVPPGTISPDKVSVSLLPAPSASDSSPLLLLTNGEPEPNMSEERASAILSEEDFEVEIDLGGGKEEARVWTCDLSHEYVTINGSYRS